MDTLTLWCNQDLNPDQKAQLSQAANGHEVLFANGPEAAGWLARSDIAFGQPPVEAVLTSEALRWIQVSSAGYGRYDTPDVRETFRRRGVLFTKSSAVYAEPCAQQVMASVLAGARCLPDTLNNQRTERSWPSQAIRSQCRLLNNQRIVLVGFGSIGKRLVEMLRPFDVDLVGVRRTPAGDEGIEMLRQDDPELAEALGGADHVINLLPGTDDTNRFFDAARLGQIRSGARFYNIGRGTTVDQAALNEALSSGRLHSAWLDVTDPEPLLADSPLWQLDNCYISPHAAGGHHNEVQRLLEHFLDNFQRFLAGDSLVDRALAPV